MDRRITPNAVASDDSDKNVRVPGQDIHEDEDVDANKYRKSTKRRCHRGKGVSAGVEGRLELIACGILLVVLLIFVWLVMQSRQDANYERAWNQWKRAKSLLRRRMHKNHGRHDGHVGPHVFGSGAAIVHNGEPNRGGDGHDNAPMTTQDLMHLSDQQMRQAQSLSTLTDSQLLDLFEATRPKDTSDKLRRVQKQFLTPILKEWAHRVDHSLHANTKGGLRWIRPYLLPPNGPTAVDQKELMATPNFNPDDEPQILFHVKRRRLPADEPQEEWAWKKEWQQMQQKTNGDEKSKLGPAIDYTQQRWYKYPDLMSSPPMDGGYPKLQPLGDLLRKWPQTQDIKPDQKIEEVLLHFNYSDPAERAMATRFREAHLPFKVYDIPDIDYVTKLWTDEYVHQQFDRNPEDGGGKDGMGLNKQAGTAADGLCQESPNHFFAFFVPAFWQTATMGLPPVRNNDFTFAEWAKHARYADAKRLSSDQPHYYWQAGARKKERFRDVSKQSFISRDLNKTLSATQDNFFIFNLAAQKGVQCRFGERGVTAATHYDGGQNMIAMLTGAKRYILSPPRACPELGVFSAQKSPIFRHSLLNFDHIQYWDQQEEQKRNDQPEATDWLGQTMSQTERDWLHKASEAPALETVLKAGEVLFLPSFWFHYIVSVQKSAQCNVRSGEDKIGTREFGNFDNIEQCGYANESPKQQ